MFEDPEKTMEEKLASSRWVRFWGRIESRTDYFQDAVTREKALRFLRIQLEREGIDVKDLN